VQAIDMCGQYKVKITEDMAEKMTLPKPAEEDAAANAARNSLLCRVAKLCKKQGAFHLATKKYTQVCARGDVTTCCGFCDNSMREKDWRCRKRSTSPEQGDACEVAVVTRLRQTRLLSACMHT
jgi:hypothetical protein